MSSRALEERRELYRQGRRCGQPIPTIGEDLTAQPTAPSTGDMSAQRTDKKKKGPAWPKSPSPNEYYMLEFEEELAAQSGPATPLQIQRLMVYRSAAKNTEGVWTREVFKWYEAKREEEWVRDGMPLVKGSLAERILSGTGGFTSIDDVPATAFNDIPPDGDNDTSRDDDTPSQCCFDVQADGSIILHCKEMAATEALPFQVPEITDREKALMARGVELGIHDGKGMEEDLPDGAAWDWSKIDDEDDEDGQSGSEASTIKEEGSEDDAGKMSNEEYVAGILGSLQLS
ncbi:unnamed protein product [Zymoseptoria tritici ST99CH_3D7]|uniref:Uncharacterized protein n=1 Tax=Zymoseptoria tritici (strain ST99CH_3D7) TaxID=1276538 RepID=A0A1X7RZM7_ZYMT9|nr:unnamed protein product [Zymoseptoria tritici ST99CH_3D7]